MLARLDRERELTISALKALRASAWWLNRPDHAAPMPIALTLYGVGELTRPLVELVATLPIVSLDVGICSLPASIAPTELFRPGLLEVMIECLSFPPPSPAPGAETTGMEGSQVARAGSGDAPSDTSNADGWRPFSFLATLQNLESLVVSGCDDFYEDDLGLLTPSNCPKLRRLVLFYLYRVSSVNALRSCGALQLLVVYISGPAPYCDGLAECWRLEELDLHGNGFGGESHHSFRLPSGEGLQHLQKVRISSLDLLDVSPLAQCGSLEELLLLRCHLNDIEGLTKAPAARSLRLLDLNQTNITELPADMGSQFPFLEYLRFSVGGFRTEAAAGDIGRASQVRFSQTSVREQRQHASRRRDPAVAQPPDSAAVASRRGRRGHRH